MIVFVSLDTPVNHISDFRIVSGELTGVALSVCRLHVELGASDCYSSSTVRIYGFRYIS